MSRFITSFNRYQRIEVLSKRIERDAHKVLENTTQLALESASMKRTRSIALRNLNRAVEDLQRTLAWPVVCRLTPRRKS